MKTYEIKEELANAILNYLVQQTYKDVSAMVAGLMQLKPVDDKPKGGTS